MTEYYSNGLARMDLKADTMVTIQVDLNTGWYAHDFLWLVCRGVNVRQVKTRIPSEDTYREATIGFHH